MDEKWIRSRVGVWTTHDAHAWAYLGRVLGPGRLTPTDATGTPPVRVMLEVTRAVAAVAIAWNARRGVLVVAAACTCVLNIGGGGLALPLAVPVWSHVRGTRRQRKSEKARRHRTEGTVEELRSRWTSIVTRLRHRPTRHGGPAVNLAVAGPSSARVWHCRGFEDGSSAEPGDGSHCSWPVFSVKVCFLEFSSSRVFECFPMRARPRGMTFALIGIDAPPMTSRHSSDSHSIEGKLKSSLNVVTSEAKSVRERDTLTVQMLRQPWHLVLPLFLSHMVDRSSALVDELARKTQRHTQHLPTRG